MEDRRTLLATLEDAPLLVEARGLLRRDGTLLVPSRERAAAGFVIAPEHDLAAGYGRPEPGLSDAVRAAAVAGGVEPGALRFRAAPQVLDEWGAARAPAAAHREVRVLVHDSGRARLEALAERHGTAPLGEDDPLVEDLPARLRRELRALGTWPRATVALAGGSPVAVAHAFVETEGFWDVSVETDAPFRREGFGAAAVAALTLDRLDEDRVAVWAAAASNRASLALARKLGFEDAGRWVEWGPA